MRLSKSPFHIIILLTLLVSILLASCEIPQTLQDAVTGDEQIDASIQFPAWAIRAAAGELYDSLETDEGDPADVIRRIVTALDIYQDPYADQDTILARIEDGFPILLEDHILAMASAYQTGMLVTLDSFIETLQAWEIEGKTPSGNITIEHFTDGFEGLPEQDEYSLGELWPAFILHLGLERAARDDTLDDPVWGDGMLDPLQFTLFSNLVFMTAEDVNDVSHWGRQNPLRQMGAFASLIPSYLLTSRDNPGMPLNDMSLVESGVDITDLDWEEFIQKNFTKVIADRIRDYISSLVGLPFTRSEAIKAIICASVILYSHEMTLESEHVSVNRRWPENPPGSNPYQTQLTTHLMFDFVPYNEASKFIIEYACGGPIPDPGPISGKPLEWFIEDDLPNHGNLDTKKNTTANDGNAHNMYTTLDEEVPRILRKGMPKPAGGRVIVKASQILPDKWSFLELMVRDVHHVGQGAFYLVVQHYEFPELQLRFTVSVRIFSDDGQILKESQFHSAVQLTLDEEGDYYHGKRTLYYNAWYLRPDAKDIIHVGSGVNCNYSDERIDGEIEVHLLLDPTDPDLQLFFRANEHPVVEITQACEAPYGMITGTTDMWESLTYILSEDIGAYGFQARGPWQPGPDWAAAVIATNSYSESLFGILEADIELELLRR